MRVAVLMLSAMPFAAVADLSGKWMIDGDVVGNAVSLDCTVQQSADASLGGSCGVNGMPPIEITGGVTGGTEFTFSFVTAGYMLTYIGTVEGDTMMGDIEVAGVMGMFTGQRVE